MRTADERRARGAGAMKAEAVQAREASERRLSFMVSGLWLCWWVVYCVCVCVVRHC